jgi:hypothetical protein
MTFTSSLAPSERTGFVQRAGLVCLAAGLLGAASGVFVVVVDPSVPDSRFSYPFAAGGFVAIQLWFAVQHLGLLVGQHALWVSGALGASRAARIGHVTALAGMVLLTVTEVLATWAASSPYPSDRTDVLDILYGVASLAIGVGLVVAGVAGLRAHTRTGPLRWLPLTLGIWVFVPMTPMIMAGFVPARLSITGWMLLYAALGWALARDRRPHGG